MRARLAILAPLAAVAMAYAPQTTFDGIPLRRNDAAEIRFFLNPENAPEGPVLEALQAAADSWSGAPSAMVKFAPIEIDQTPADPFDGRNMIVFADTPEARSVVGSAIAVAAVVYFEDGEIFESDILFNPEHRFSMDGAEETFDVQSIAAHEIGHALGANHSGLMSALMYHATSRRPAVKPVVTDDDKAFLTEIYPSESAVDSHGLLYGKVTFRTGEPARGALVAAYDPATGVTVGGLASLMDGSYFITAPRGTYHLYAEPLDGPVRPPNVYPFEQQVDAEFRTAFFGELHAPLPVEIDTEAEILVDGGVAGFDLHFIGTDERIGPGAAAVASGGAVDLILAGPGLVTDSAAYEVRALGAGVHPGSARPDPRITINGEPVLRVTVDIEPRETEAIAGILVLKDGIPAALSGSLVIAPVAAEPEQPETEDTQPQTPDGVTCMPAHVSIDDNLLEEARRIGSHRTKREAVHAALREYVGRRKRREILELFGAIEYEPGYDYKRERRKPRVARR